MIRTIEELEALPEAAVIRECDLHPRTWVFEKSAEGDWMVAGLGRPWRSNEIYLPAQLLHPRKFGEEDAERVAKMFARNLEDWCVESLPGEEPAPWLETARAALDALVEQ